MPLHTTPSVAKEEEMHAAVPSELTVLVVDDSPVYRKLVEHTLQKERYTVLLAKGGNEALRIFAQHRPAVVVTDWTMPDISGIHL